MPIGPIDIRYPLFNPSFSEGYMKHRLLISSAVLSVGLLFSPMPAMAESVGSGCDDQATDVLVGYEASRIQSAAREDEPLEQPVSLRSCEGMKRLAHARFIADFPVLANNYEAQINKLFCGPASGTIVLNSLRDRYHADGNPVDPAMVPPEALQYISNPFFKRYTQNTFFNENTDLVKTRLQVFGQPMSPGGPKEYGLQLHELRGMLEAHGLTVAMHAVDPAASRWEVMADLLKNLQEPGDFVIINYQRKAIGQVGGGHFSPIAAYDAVSRSFLVMDVNPMNADWVWVKANTLFDAMQTFDTIENRGYLLVSD